MESSNNPQSPYLALKKSESSFETAIREGLGSYPKRLPSRFIYDKEGDALFRRIMDMPEYYLTNCETEIFEQQKVQIIDALAHLQDGFDLVELGAGDGSKTRILLDEIIRRDLNFRYLPIDISQNALSGLSNKLSGEFTDLEILPQQGTYFDILEEMQQWKERPKVILFLGSNIGNLLHPQAIDFLQKLRAVMGSSDLLLLGCDQKKEPQVVLDAYNDPAGITEAFNKNLLERINREYGADFDTKRFLHWETYDPESGTARSYLVARESFEVTIPDLDMQVSFEAWESIHTEISQKYDDRTLEWIAGETGLEIATSFTDSKGYYKDYLLRIPE